MAKINPNDTLIFDAVRTPRGKGREGGGLATTAPVELVKQLVDAIGRRNGEQSKSIDSLILGCVGQIGTQGGHLALVSKLYCSLPETASVWTLNNYCASGLSAVLAGADKVASGSAELVMAGGVESMSSVPFLADNGSYYADPAFSVAMKYVPVAVSADILAHTKKVTRAELDTIAVESHERASMAQSENQCQQSLIPIIDGPGTTLLARDEYVRAGMTTERVAAFPAAFASLGATYAPTIKAALGIDHIEPVHAVAHAPGTADGAGLILLGTLEGGQQRGLRPRARIVAHAEAGGNPVLSLTAGCFAMDKALAKASLTLDDIDVIEYMEAFAVVPALFYRDHPKIRDKVNIYGGHIARGHALGATGAILLSTLLDALEQKNLAIGMVVAFAASGIGSAIIIRRD